MHPILLKLILLVGATQLTHAFQDEQPVKECYLTNCEKCSDLATCAICEQGYRKLFVRYGKRTLCTLSCGPTEEDYIDQEGQLACRKRTDVAGCETPWCIYCKPGYFRVQKGILKYACESSCPAHLKPTWLPGKKTKVCTA